MRNIPILMSTQMVQATIAGRKTMTRRIVKSRTGLFQVETAKFEPDFRGYYKNRTISECDDDERSTGRTIMCPYGEEGDILWVRETFAYTQFAFDKSLIAPRGEYGILGSEIYKADECNDDWDGKWKPNIFMPKEACRLFLKIKSIQIQRLHDITYKDALAEGIQYYEDAVLGRMYKDYMADASGYGHPDHDYPIISGPINSFKTLWKSINGEQSWKDNPWVWVIEFEKCAKPENFLL